MLYQLSYTHHGRTLPTGEPGALRSDECSGPEAGRRNHSAAPVSAARCVAAIVRDVAESGPGSGTKTASR